MTDILASKPWRVDIFLHISDDYFCSHYFRTKREANEYCVKMWRSNRRTFFPGIPFVDHSSSRSLEIDTLKTAITCICREKMGCYVEPM